MTFVNKKLFMQVFLKIELENLHNDLNKGIFLFL